jgi:hypothetical protein
VGDTEIGLGAELGAEILVGVPEVDHALGHVLEVVLDPFTNVTALFQLGDALDGLTTRCSKQTSVLDVVLQLLEVAFQSQGHAEAVLTKEHQIVMQTAKALLVGFDANVRLHHGGSKDEIQLVLLQLTIDSTHRASAGCIITGGFKRFIYGYGINLFHKNLRYLHFLLDFCGQIIYNIIT